MGFRATLAGLLAAILLSFSFVAEACAIRCDLKSVGRDCHSLSHQAQSSADPQMPPMAGMDDATPETGAAAAPAISVSAPCFHNMCVQQPALQAHEDHALVHALPVLELVAIVEASLKPRASSGWLFVRDSPHILSSSPALLSILRI